MERGRVRRSGRPARKLTVVVPGKRGEHEEDRSDVERYLGQHRSERVRQYVTDQDAGERRARCARRVDVRRVRDRPSPLPDRPRHRRPQDDAKDPHEKWKAHRARSYRYQTREDNDREQERGDGAERIADERDDRIKDPAVVEPRGRSEEEPQSDVNTQDAGDDTEVPRRGLPDRVEQVRPEPRHDTERVRPRRTNRVERRYPCHILGELVEGGSEDEEGAEGHEQITGEKPGTHQEAEAGRPTRQSLSERGSRQRWGRLGGGGHRRVGHRRAPPRGSRRRAMRSTTNAQTRTTIAIRKTRGMMGERSPAIRLAKIR